MRKFILKRLLPTLLVVAMFVALLPGTALGIVFADYRVVDVKNADTKNGAFIHLWQPYPTLRNQMFQFEVQKDGSYMIKAMHSGKYLEGWGPSSGAGIPIWQWSYENYAQMKWDIAEAGKDNKNEMNVYIINKYKL